MSDVSRAVPAASKLGACPTRLHLHSRRADFSSAARVAFLAASYGTSGVGSGTSITPTSAAS